MKIPRIAELDRGGDFFGTGSVVASVLTALGITDEDLPNIVPEPPEFSTDEEAHAWIEANLPAVARKLADLESGAA